MLNSHTASPVGAFMRNATLPGISALVVLVSCLLFAQQQSTAPPLPTNAPPQGQPAEGKPALELEQPSREPPASPSPPPSANEPAQPPTPPPTAPPPASEPGQQAAATPKGRKNPKVEAWEILDDACTGNKTITRAMAIRVLGLMPNDAKALRLAEKALADEKPEVRAAAATGLGDMKSRSSIPKLKEALDDTEPPVALAAAHALDEMHDESAFAVYYESLTGQRQAGKDLVASQAAVHYATPKTGDTCFPDRVMIVSFVGIGSA